MAITYQYGKLRSNFGRQPQFAEYGPEMCDSVPVNEMERKLYILRNPVHSSMQHTPCFSHCEINTIRAEYTTTGINHAEGGWPRDVNLNDPEATQRYRRKIEKDEPYIHCVMALSGGMENLINQNNAIDMYQTYYDTIPPIAKREHISLRTVNVYKESTDPPLAFKRPISSICWRPEGGNKFAVTYVDVDFDRNVRSSVRCYIWDTENANYPETHIIPPYALMDLQYNPRNTEVVAGGMINGQVAIWDLRTKNQEPTAACPPHVAHRDLVRNVRFVHARNGMEFYSGGPDGACKWWDMRKLNDPIDEIIIEPVNSVYDVPSMATSYGISCLEFEPTIPTRFMVGTENGCVFIGNKKGKTPLDKLPAKFLAQVGPVWKVERNPGFLKNFLTVGDWTLRIWSEDCRDSAMIWSPPLRHKVTHGTWSPTRLSLLLITQANGVITLWDLLRRQHQPVLSVQLCEEPLCHVAPHEAGALAACGNVKGNIYLLELSRSLTDSAKNDKALLTAMFERESRRERILEARLREIRVKIRAADEHSPTASASDMDAAIGDRDLHEATAEFQQITKKELTTI